MNHTNCSNVTQALLAYQAFGNDEDEDWEAFGVTQELLNDCVVRPEQAVQQIVLNVSNVSNATLEIFNISNITTFNVSNITNITNLTGFIALDNGSSLMLQNGTVTVVNITIVKTMEQLFEEWRNATLTRLQREYFRTFASFADNIDLHNHLITGHDAYVFDLKRNLIDNLKNFDADYFTSQKPMHVGEVMGHGEYDALNPWDGRLMMPETLRQILRHNLLYRNRDEFIEFAPAAMVTLIENHGELGNVTTLFNDTINYFNDIMVWKAPVRPDPVIDNCTNITAALRPYGHTLYGGNDSHSYSADDAEYANGTYYFLGHEVEVSSYINATGGNATKIELPDYCEPLPFCNVT
jgi:hypothetical protein